MIKLWNWIVSLFSKKPVKSSDILWTSKPMGMSIPTPKNRIPPPPVPPSSRITLGGHAPESTESSTAPWLEDQRKKEYPDSFSLFLANSLSSDQDSSYVDDTPTFGGGDFGGGGAGNSYDDSSSGSSYDSGNNSSSSSSDSDSSYDSGSSDSSSSSWD